MLAKHSSAIHNVDFYASELCISRQYLNRILNSYTHNSASKWIAFALTGKISNLLSNTTMPIQRIAETLDFPTQAALAKFFKQQTGLTPTDFRIQNFPMG
ncbi:MAG: helix-turn-helix domain-containing protein [Bacteroidales bacterium]|nr:helix-turn-helix domain-containing protein [Bacteroidales bacterium]